MLDGKVGVGILGCGVVANYHASAVNELSNKAVLVGVADRNFDRASDFAESHGSRAFKDFDSLLACPEIDIVCICTPSGSHAEHVIAAVNAGKNIVVEKPLGITKEQLDAVENAVKKSGVKATCILQSRFYRSTKKVKSAIDEGLIGKIVCADVYMKYNRTQQYYDSARWRGTVAMDGGGALMNQGIHGVDMLLHLAGPVKSVYAYSKTLTHKIEVEDNLVCALEFVNGGVGVIEASTSVMPGYPRLINIHGEKGTISLEENSIVRWDISTNANEEDLVITPTRFTGARTPTAISPDGHLNQISDMIDSVLDNKEPIVSISEGRRCVDLILAIYKSAKEKREIILNNL